MKMAMTGISSFTGCHIARAFVNAGHEVMGFLTRPIEMYGADSCIRARLHHSGVESSRLVPQAPFGSSRFLDKLKENPPDVFINHGAEIKGYRSPDFDVNHSVSKSLQNHLGVIHLLKSHGVKGIIHSGTVFEPIDGLPAFSAYGQAKFEVSESLRQACEQLSWPFSKIYIPNPIGQFENSDRLIPTFVQRWKSGTLPHLSAPRVIWDNIPAPWLAKFYVQAANSLLLGKSAILRPSGLCVDLETFVNLFCLYARRSGVSIPMNFTVGDTQTETLVPRLNTHPCPELQSLVEKDQFFGDWTRSMFGFNSTETLL